MRNVKRAEVDSFAHRIISIILAIVFILAVLLPLSAKIIEIFIPAKESRDALNNIEGWVEHLRDELKKSTEQSLSITLPVSIANQHPIGVHKSNLNKLCIYDAGTTNIRRCTTVLDTELIVTGQLISSQQNELFDVEIIVEKAGGDNAYQATIAKK